jgi:2-polyprenyl-3-methyl-5-hydroxy-6-metoxy-1,4-benzoquinol methylase
VNEAASRSTETEDDPVAMRLSAPRPLATRGFPCRARASRLRFRLDQAAARTKGSIVRHQRIPLDIESLTPREIAAFKELERAGRDVGAPSYLQRIGSRGAFRLHAEDLALLRHIAPRPEQRVLDAGCGVGRHALMVAARVRHVTGVDFSRVALKVLSREAARRNLQNLEVRLADVCAVPEDLLGFDTVYSSEVLQHVPSAAERQRALRGFHRTLRPGGRCIVNVLCWNRRVREARDGLWSDGGGYCHYFAPAELRDLFEAAGFRDVTLHGLLITPGTLTRHLPTSFARWEARLSSWRFLAGIGRFLIGVGRA